MQIRIFICLHKLFPVKNIYVYKCSALFKVAFDKLRSGEYAAYGAEMKQKFLQNLGG